MEAARFGFGRSLSPAFKFDPTDDDIVAHYLLPRALGVPDPPFPDAVIEDDTASLPPPELLALHGHATSHHAFFVDGNGGRRDREIKGGAGGTWRGQQGRQKTLTLLRPGGGEAVDIKYRRYDLTYKKFGEKDEEQDANGKKRKRKNGGTPAGWVMHEYTIVSPPLHDTVLSRINRRAGKINDDQQQGDFHQHHQVFPAVEMPGPSYYQDDLPYQEQAGPSHRHDFAYQEQPGPSHHHDFQYQEQAWPSHHHNLPYQEQAWPTHHQDFPQEAGPGPSYYQHPIGMVCGGGGSDGSQADDASWYGDNVTGMGHGLVHMLCAGEEDFAGDHTYSHHPHDMICTRGEGFSAGDASFYAGDYAGGMGNGYVNMPCAGEGFGGDYHHPQDMTCGGVQGFSDGSQADDASDNGGGMGAGTTATTCTTTTSTCPVTTTSSPADDQDKSSKT